MTATGTAVLQELLRVARRRVVATAAANGLAVALPAFVVVTRFAGRDAGAWIAVAVVATALVRAAWSARRIDLLAVVAHLNRALPLLAESAELLAADPAHLTPVARLGQTRAAALLATVDRSRVIPSRGIHRALTWVGVSLVVSFILAAVALRPVHLAAPVVSGAPMPEGPGAWPRDLTIAIEVESPAYTELRPRTVTGLDLAVAAGSTVRFIATAGTEIDGVALVFADGERIDLERTGDGRFRTSLVATATRLYRVRADLGDRPPELSPTARLAVIEDQPPAIRIAAPPPVLEVDASVQPTVDLQVEVEDDYRVATAEMVVTLASGAGEQVMFRERRLPFTARDEVSPARWRLGASLDLVALGVTPGAELYLHVEATDNRAPSASRARSRTHVLRWPGAEAAAVGLGSGLPVVQLPAAFRSQRQIIIDTERLIAERAGLAAAEYRERSGRLGLDQRALRMRYGTLMGDEFEAGRPAGDPDVGAHDGEGDGPVDEHAEDLGDRRGQANIPAGLGHQHDSVEAATFFPGSVKAQLRAVLAEMWEAEGLLRVGEPEAALPSEYRALRLLKDLQERARVYVRKVAFDTPPLRPDEARLTGDLDEIPSRREVAATVVAPTVARELRSAVTAVRRASGATAISAAATLSLERARELLRARAAAGEALDLAALDCLDAMLAAGAVAQSDVERFEAAVWPLLGDRVVGAAGPVVPAGELADRYRARLLAEAGR